MNNYTKKIFSKYNSQLIIVILYFVVYIIWVIDSIIGSQNLVVEMFLDIDKKKMLVNHSRPRFFFFWLDLSFTFLFITHQLFAKLPQRK